MASRPHQPAHGGAVEGAEDADGVGVTVSQVQIGQGGELASEDADSSRRSGVDAGLVAGCAAAVAVVVGLCATLGIVAVLRSQGKKLGLSEQHSETAEFEPNPGDLHEATADYVWDSSDSGVRSMQDVSIPVFSLREGPQREHSGLCLQSSNVDVHHGIFWEPLVFTPCQVDLLENSLTEGTCRCRIRKMHRRPGTDDCVNLSAATSATPPPDAPKREFSNSNARKESLSVIEVTSCVPEQRPRKDRGCRRRSSDACVC